MRRHRALIHDLRPLVSIVSQTVKNIHAERSSLVNLLLGDKDKFTPILNVLNSITLSSLGLMNNMHNYMHPVPLNPSTVRYIEVHETSQFSISIFVLPNRSKIPLHDHPGMCVFSRVLSGKLKVKQYHPIKSNNQLIGKLYCDEWVESPFTSSLFSDFSNIHEFEAGDEGVAILDVIIPPYVSWEGRNCTYYQEMQSVKLGESTILKPTPPPKGFNVIDGWVMEGRVT